MKRLTIALLFVAAAAAAAQAQTPVNLEAETAELLRLHKQGREAHYKTDVEMLLANSPEESFSVSAGKVNRPRKADVRRMFTGYFRDAKYYEWDDTEPPVVRVSKDASMAWMITRVRVRRVQKDKSGKEVEEKFVYAGLTTYEKQGGKWVRAANASTFEP